MGRDELTEKREKRGADGEERRRSELTEKRGEEMSRWRREG